MATSTSTAPIAADAPGGGFAPLATARLVLRPLLAADAPALHRLINDWEIARNLSAVPYPYSRIQADDWIASTARQLAEGTGIHLAIAEAVKPAALIGGIGLRIDGRRRTGHLGYWLDRKSWGRGIAREAASGFVDWALRHLSLDRLEATVADDNPGSIAVLRHLGFRPAGEARESFQARGGVHPVRRFLAERADLGSVPVPRPVPIVPPPPLPDRPLVLVVACALVDTDGRVLLTQRPAGKPMAGLWEFPGGKLDAGELPEPALIRELREELGIDVAAACLAPLAFASHPYDGFHLLMPLYVCRRWSGIPRGAEGQALAWVRPARLVDYPMPDADRPLVPMLRDLL